MAAIERVEIRMVDLKPKVKRVDANTASSVQKKLRMLVFGVAPLPTVFMTCGANDSYP